MMKRMVVVMMMAVMVLTGGIVLGMMPESNGATVKNVGQVRTIQCVVLGENDGLMTLEDWTHNLWQVDDEDLHKGDVLTVWIDDMNTPEDLTDDVILDYCDVIVD